jgi:hypothetical protein
MRKSRFTEEQMVTVLREADRTTVAEAAKKGTASWCNRPDAVGRVVETENSNALAPDHQDRPQRSTTAPLLP